VWISIGYGLLLSIAFSILIFISSKEFPNNAGAGQPFTPADTANFLLFLTALRVALGTSSLHKIVSFEIPLLMTSELL
jgi:hypothetical protein